MEEKKSGIFKTFIEVLIVVAVIGGGVYYYFQNNGGITNKTPKGESMENPIVAGYDESNDTHDVFPSPSIREEAESIWFKFVTKKDTDNHQRCVAIFDDCEEGKVVKDAVLYDETGENEICDVIWWENNFQSEPFPAKEDQVFYLKVDLNEHLAGKYLTIHSWTE